MGWNTLGKSRNWAWLLKLHVAMDGVNSVVWMEMYNKPTPFSKESVYPVHLEALNKLSLGQTRKYR